MKKLILILVLVSIFSFFIIILTGKKMSLGVYKYLDSEVKKIVTNIVNSSTNEFLSKNFDYNKLIDSKSNQNKEIEFFDYNTKEVNKILFEITTDIQNRLLKLETGDISEFNLANTLTNIDNKKIDNGIVCSIPMGTVLGIPIFSNIGPIIPVKISFVGDVISNLKTTMKSYGINNVYLQIDIVVEVSEQITMPMITENKRVVVTSPLFIRVIQGKIPDYYFDRIVKESNSTSILE